MFRQMRHVRRWTVLLGVCLCTFAACSPPSGGVTRGEANVESIEILILESFPVQVQVIARGYLPDGCTEIDQVSQRREEETFWIEITTARPTGQSCTQVIVPFEESVSLDVAGLPAGTYTVDVNGVSGTFTLAVDNVLEEDGG
ncbi:MAG: hypothetical protein JW900_03905 [Anaerolineae bacterium]|nr:hypothetical protein [Anaerolineae bacterium]